MNGVIADLEIAGILLKSFSKIVYKRRSWRLPKVVVYLPMEVTSVEMKAIKNTILFGVRAREAIILESSCVKNNEIPKNSNIIMEIVP